jgi:carbonic anhydrase
MPVLDKLLQNNRSWAADRVQRDPSFFTGCDDQQAPEFLWIGCSDSRVPANEIVGLDPASCSSTATSPTSSSTPI